MPYTTIQFDFRRQTSLWLTAYSSVKFSKFKLCRFDAKYFTLPFCDLSHECVMAPPKMSVTLLKPNLFMLRNVRNIIKTRDPSVDGNRRLRVRLAGTSCTGTT